ncbi:MAG: TraR/DksA family transcriptional regulator [bacterium]|nr:TraR/DksA family transcriptional regulator [bacterium]
MDVADQAQDTEQLERDNAIRNAHRIPRRVPIDKVCIDCGYEIEAKRREANPGTKRCIDCQTEHEGGGA